MATRATATAFLAMHPTATAAQLSETFGIPIATAHRWRNDWEAKAASNAPADSLAQEDRDSALSSVRDCYTVIQRNLDHILGDPIEELLLKRTQAMKNLQALAAGVIEAHPGLLDITSDGQAPIATKDDADRFLASLGEDADLN